MNVGGYRRKGHIFQAATESIASLRKEAGSPCAEKEELEEATTQNFYRVFSRKEK